MTGWLSMSLERKEKKLYNKLQNRLKIFKILSYTNRFKRENIKTEIFPTYFYFIDPKKYFTLLMPIDTAIYTVLLKNIRSYKILLYYKKFLLI
jgi:hypothetical protein